MCRNTIMPNTSTIDKFFKNFNLPLYLGKTAVKHVKSFFKAAVTKGFNAKVTDIAEQSTHHRTTLGHFLNKGVWDETLIERRIKQQVLKRSLKMSSKMDQPLFVIHDDTVCVKAKPSSQAHTPIQGTGYHFSHLEGKPVWGNQLLATMLQCNGQSLIYDLKPYDKEGKSKIDLVCDIATSLPLARGKAYALFDTWFTSATIINTYASRGYHCIGGLKTNRIIYPSGIRISIKDFAKHIKLEDVDLVTVNDSNYYVYRYEGPINDVKNTIVLISWPVDSFLKPHAIKAFICTDTTLPTEVILEYYSKRWSIEVFFKEQKVHFGLDKYQIRSSKGIRRLWVLQKLLHLFCTMGTGDSYNKLSDGLRKVKMEHKVESIHWIYNCGKRGIPMDKVLQHLKAA